MYHYFGTSVHFALCIAQPVFIILRKYELVTSRWRWIPVLVAGIPVIALMVFTIAVKNVLVGKLATRLKRLHILGHIVWGCGQLLVPKSYRLTPSNGHCRGANHLFDRDPNRKMEYERPVRPDSGSYDLLSDQHLLKEHHGNLPTRH